MAKQKVSQEEVEEFSVFDVEGANDEETEQQLKQQEADQELFAEFERKQSKVNSIKKVYEKLQPVQQGKYVYINYKDFPKLTDESIYGLHFSDSIMKQIYLFYNEYTDANNMHYNPDNVHIVQFYNEEEDRDATDSEILEYFNVNNAERYYHYGIVITKGSLSYSNNGELKSRIFVIDSSIKDNIDFVRSLDSAEEEFMYWNEGTHVDAFGTLCKYTNTVIQLSPSEQRKFVNKYIVQSQDYDRITTIFRYNHMNCENSEFLDGVVSITSRIMQDPNLKDWSLQNMFDVLEHPELLAPEQIKNTFLYSNGDSVCLGPFVSSNRQDLSLWYCIKLVETLYVYGMAMTEKMNGKFAFYGDHERLVRLIVTQHHSADENIMISCSQSCNHWFNIIAAYISVKSNFKIKFVHLEYDDKEFLSRIQSFSFKDVDNCLPLEDCLEKMCHPFDHCILRRSDGSMPFDCILAKPIDYDSAGNPIYEDLLYAADTDEVVDSCIDNRDIKNKFELSILMVKVIPYFRDGKQDFSIDANSVSRQTFRYEQIKTHSFWEWFDIHVTETDMDTYIEEKRKSDIDKPYRAYEVGAAESKRLLKFLNKCMKILSLSKDNFDNQYLPAYTALDCSNTLIFEYTDPATNETNFYVGYVYNIDYEVLYKIRLCNDYINNYVFHKKLKLNDLYYTFPVQVCCDVRPDTCIEAQGMDTEWVKFFSPDQREPNWDTIDLDAKVFRNERYNIITNQYEDYSPINDYSIGMVCACVSVCSENITNTCGLHYDTLGYWHLYAKVLRGESLKPCMVRTDEVPVRVLRKNFLTYFGGPHPYLGRNPERNKPWLNFTPSLWWEDDEWTLHKNK